MSILDRILGRPPVSAPPAAAPPRPFPIGASPTAAPPTVELPSAVSARAGTSPVPTLVDVLLRGYDQSGRAIAAGLEAWRRDVLLPGLAANRNRPDALFELISRALTEGLTEDVLEAARHLAETDPQPRRGAALLGAT